MANGQNTAAFLGVLKGIAPVLGTVLSAGNPLGGVVAGAAVDFLAGKLNIQEKTPEAVTEALSQLPATSLAQLELEFKQHCADNDLQLNLAQIEVNKTEAVSESLFVAGWRPFLGWIGGFGIGYQFLVRPLLNGIVVLLGGDVDSFPALELQDLIAIVTTMLGQSALRSWDKRNGTANGH